LTFFWVFLLAAPFTACQRLRAPTAVLWLLLFDFSYAVFKELLAWIHRAA
jgi:hypothetical protein